MKNEGTLKGYMFMKKWVLVALFLTHILLRAYGCESSNQRALEKLGSDYTYMKSYVINSSQQSDSTSYTLILKAGYAYQIPIYMYRLDGVDDFHVKLFVAKRVGSAFHEVGGWTWDKATRYGKLEYHASRTGIYILRFYYSEHSCGAAVLGCNENARSWIFDFEELEKGSLPSRQYLQTHSSKESEDGYISFEYGNDVLWSYKLSARHRPAKEIAEIIQLAIYQKYGFHVKVVARYGLRDP